MQPEDAAIAETMLFLQDVIAPSRRILEVGCRDGRLAARLLAIGHEIVAIDSSLEHITTARGRGVDARYAHWPTFTENPFDTILFVRSLHHMRSLKEAIAGCKPLLRSGGIVIFDEFAFDEIGPISAEWLYQTAHLLRECSFVANLNGPIPSLWTASSPMEAWYKDHKGDMPSISEMLMTISRFFEEVSVTPAPYLYRYLCPLLPQNDTGYRVAHLLASLEKRIASAAGEPLIGRRLICSVPQ
jgi:SAM-dependent methyltransferase